MLNRRIWGAIGRKEVTMAKNDYELTNCGVNAAIADYIKQNWNDLSFVGLDSDSLMGIVSVQVCIQKEFKGKGEYQFVGKVRPQIKNDQGLPFEIIHRISGFAHVAINEKGFLLINGFDGPLSVEPR